jgi:hypothetical protein
MADNHRTNAITRRLWHEQHHVTQIYSYEHYYAGAKKSPTRATASTNAASPVQLVGTLAA